MSAVTSSAWLDQMNWPTPAHRALALALAKDDPVAALHALEQGVPPDGVMPSLIDESQPGEDLATWSGLGWLAVALLADKPRCARVLVEAGASLTQPDEVDAPIALVPFQRHREDWVDWLDAHAVGWTASHPQAAHGYGPLALALSGEGPSRDRLVERALGRPGQWDEASAAAVWLALVVRGSVQDIPRVAAAGLRWDDTSPACREAMLAAALVGHQGRRPAAIAWLDHLAQAHVPLAASFTYIHPAWRAAYAQRLLAHSASLMAVPASALDPLAARAEERVSSAVPALAPAGEVLPPLVSQESGSVMGSPRRRPSP